MNEKGKNRIVDLPSLALVDDDQIFGSILKKTAHKLGFELDFFAGLGDLDFISQLAKYDIILVDFQMNDDNGLEIAAYIPKFVSHKTVILVSNTRLEELFGPKLPPFISDFIHKEVGPDQIIKRSIDIFMDAREKSKKYA